MAEKDIAEKMTWGEVDSREEEGSMK